MSDRVGIMHRGKLEQIGTPSYIYLSPATKFVAEFMGEANVFTVTKSFDDTYRSDTLGVDLRCTSNDGLNSGFLVVRPEYLRFVDDEHQGDNVLRGSIVNEYVLGSRILYHVHVGAEVLTLEKLAGEALPAGISSGEVLIGWDATSGRVVAS